MNHTTKALIVPGPPPNGVIENGQDRYLDALMRGMAGRVEYIGLDDPQFARGPEQKWEPGLSDQSPLPRFRLTLLIPRNLRLLAGYIRDTWRLARLLRPYRKQVDLIHVNRVGCEIQPIAARLAGFRHIVTTIHNLPGDAEKNNWVCRLVERLSFACGDVHIAVSEATYEAWHARVGLRKKEVTTDIRPQTFDQIDMSTGIPEVAAHGGRTLCEPSYVYGSDKPRPPKELLPRSKVYGLWSKVFSIRPRGKCVVIYNGMDPVDLTGFDRQAYRRQFCEDPDHTFIIGICARLHKMKGHSVLLEAFAMLLKESEQKNAKVRKLVSAEGGKETSSLRASRASVQTLQSSQSMVYGLKSDVYSCLLLIAGSGPEEANIKAKIAELGISDHVRLLGHRNDAERFAASLDLNVLPSVALETLGYSVVEAMFHGVPSVVSDVGGGREIIEISGGGIVTPVGDAKAINSAIRIYVCDRDKCRQDGAAARVFAEKNLSARKMADETLKLYEFVMGRK